MLNPIDIVVELVRSSSILRTLIIWGSIFVGLFIIGIDQIISFMGLQDEVQGVSQFIQRNIDIKGMVDQVKQLFNK